MTDLLERVFTEAQKLPESQQNALAELWLAELEDESRWDAAFATPESQSWLESRAAEIRAAVRAGKTKPLEPERL
ncbi:MAG: hypothetical protein HC933_12540 [Pleurocapsa sp. SU_196_0]|nr:hypothetical protein [Pleurocapsa sp. SU_196_0]